MKPENILSKFDKAKSKYRYSLTDFGSLHSIEPDDKRSIKDELRGVCNVLLCMWQLSLCNSCPEDYYALLGGLRGTNTLFVRVMDKSLGRNVYAKYTPTEKDKAFGIFCNKLSLGEFESAKDALADSFLRK